MIWNIFFVTFYFLFIFKFLSPSFFLSHLYFQISKKQKSNINYVFLFLSDSTRHLISHNSLSYFLSFTQQFSHCISYILCTFVAWSIIIFVNFEFFRNLGCSKLENSTMPHDTAFEQRLTLIKKWVLLSGSDGNATIDYFGSVVDPCEVFVKMYLNCVAL